MRGARGALGARAGAARGGFPGRDVVGGGVGPGTRAAAASAPAGTHFRAGSARPGPGAEDEGFPSPLPPQVPAKLKIGRNVQIRPARPGGGAPRPSVRPLLWGGAARRSRRNAQVPAAAGRGPPGGRAAAPGEGRPGLGSPLGRHRGRPLPSSPGRAPRAPGNARARAARDPLPHGLAPRERVAAAGAGTRRQRLFHCWPASRSEPPFALKVRPVPAQAAAAQAQPRGRSLRASPGGPSSAGAPGPAPERPRLQAPGRSTGAPAVLTGGGRARLQAPAPHLGPGSPGRGRGATARSWAWWERRGHGRPPAGRAGRPEVPGVNARGAGAEKGSACSPPGRGKGARQARPGTPGPEPEGGGSRGRSVRPARSRVRQLE